MRLMVGVVGVVLLGVVAVSRSQDTSDTAIYSRGAREVPECSAVQKLQYTNSTKAFTCVADVSAAASPLPTGALVFLTSGACPDGTTEATELAGRSPIVTTVAAANAGSTGGADSVTPAGAMAWPAGVPTASGAAVQDHAAHTHTFTQSSNAATPDLLTASATGSAVAASGTTGNPSATLTHTVTQPTIAWPAGVPTFSGTALDNRSAFVRVIACRVN